MYAINACIINSESTLTHSAWVCVFQSVRPVVKLAMLLLPASHAATDVNQYQRLLARLTFVSVSYLTLYCRPAKLLYISFIPISFGVSKMLVA